MPDLMNLLAQIEAWLFSDGEYHDLSLDYDPTRIYQAKVVSKFDASPSNPSISLQVTFVCNPPFPYLNGVLQTPEEVLWQTATKDGNQFMQEFTTSGHMRFTNIGTQPAKPKITLLNNVPAGLTLTYNGGTITNNVDLKYDSMIIDCSAETVTRGSDGANLLTNISGDYFTFQPGQINLDIAAAVGAWPDNLIVLVEFAPLGV